ncbi:hypothetical protein EDC04DRAFT_2568459, partial [Pisolithus marmoratus]
PMVFIDSNGGILLWYLPSAISNANQSTIWQSITQLRVPLQQGIKWSGSCSWQRNTNYFHESANLKGTTNLSPVWFQQGHGVCYTEYQHNVILLSCSQPPNHCPEVSALLKTTAGVEGPCRWLADMAGIHALLSMTLMVIHPQMYHAGKQVLAYLATKANNEADMDMSSALSIWNTVYSSMSIMVNHATPYHMDVNGWSPWLDMLLMVGEYELLNFMIPTLDLWLCYDPGTVIAMSGSTFEHGVGHADSDCACLAYYMCENVHCSMGVSVCKLPHIAHLTS